MIPHALTQHRVYFHLRSAPTEQKEMSGAGLGKAHPQGKGCLDIQYLCDPTLKLIKQIYD